MLTPEQKERLEQLRTKEALNEEEKKELSELESLEPEDPDQDEFDNAWDEDDWDGDATDDSDGADEDDQEDEQKKDQPDETDDSDDTSIFNQTPDEDSDQEQDSDDEDEESQEETPEQKIAKLEAENAKMLQRMSSWEGRLKAEAKRANEAEQKLKQAEGKGSKSDNDVSPDGDDAKAKLSAFIQEFPDLEQPIRILIHEEAEKIVDSRFGPVEKSMTEIRDTLKLSADERHFAEITKAHPDWEQVRDSGALETWINRQPEFLRPRLHEICESGKTQEVIEMFDQYKKATGKAQQKPTSSQFNSKKKKAQSIEAVPASSGGPRQKPKQPDKDDYDGAWEHWTEQDGKK